eukprot:scaffold86225_cov21-Tisochrysis_lutea.AAC.3
MKVTSSELDTLAWDAQFHTRATFAWGHHLLVEYACVGCTFAVQGQLLRGSTSSGLDTLAWEAYLPFKGDTCKRG